MSKIITHPRFKGPPPEPADEPEWHRPRKPLLCYLRHDWSAWSRLDVRIGKGGSETRQHRVCLRCYLEEVKSLHV